MRTQGSSWRRRATSSLRWVRSFSSLSSSTRAASHSSRVPVLCFAMVASLMFWTPAARRKSCRTHRGLFHAIDSRIGPLAQEFHPLLLEAAVVRGRFHQVHEAFDGFFEALLQCG